MLRARATTSAPAGENSSSCRIEDFEGVDRHAGAVAAGNQHAAVGQQRRRVAAARRVQRSGRQPHVVRRVVYFSTRERGAVGARAAGDEHAAVGSSVAV